MIAECIGVLFFFRGLQKREEKQLRILGMLSLLLLATIYFPIIPKPKTDVFFSVEGIFNQVLRTGINWIVLFAFLRLSKQTARSICWYLSGLYVLIYMASFNLRQTLQPLALQLDPQNSDVILFFFLVIFQWGSVWCVQRTLDLGAISSAEPAFSRHPIIMIPILLELYFKFILFDPANETGQRTIDTLCYSFCATLGVLALVVLVEKNVAAQRKWNTLRMQKMQLEYEVLNAKRTMQINRDIRQLYHDMKTHLLAVDAMIGNQEGARAYVSELRSRLEKYEFKVNTGNGVADAILSEKIERASSDHIRFNICVNLKPLEFINPVDMVTIIGNAVDNAVEALQETSIGSEKIVYIKSSCHANMLILRVSNQFVGPLVMKDGNLQTRKKDTQMHGIGLNSIRKAVHRYNGTIDIQIENAGSWFHLFIMIPIQENDDTSP